MPLDPSRTVAELRELRQLTGDENGAQRVAWTETWAQAREWLRGKVADTGAEEEIDPAGNQWFTLRGASDASTADRRAHRLGAQRRLARRMPQRPRRRGGAAPDRRGGHAADDRAARRLGGRRGRALRALARRVIRRGGLDGGPGRAAREVDANGIALPDALAEHGIDLDRALEAQSQLENAAAYLELHIEQGPVLEHGPADGRRPRHVRRRAASRHLPGPGGARRFDADGQAARRARRRGEAAAGDPGDRQADRRGAVCTVGGVVTKPGIVTSVVETAE